MGCTQARVRRLFLLTAAVLVAGLPGRLEPSSHTDRAISQVGDRTVPSDCTIFTVSKGEQVYFCGNDDYILPDSYYWVDAGDDQKHGAIWIGKPGNVQQGVNERGLAYDANGLPRTDVNPHPDRLPVSGGYTSYPIHILQECATVEEVIAWVNTHQWHSFMRDQVHFADATGDAVVISAGADGEVSFTRKPPGDGFLVSTNFNVANPVTGIGYPCWRYDRAQELLGRLQSQEGHLTVQDAAGVLDAARVAESRGWTIGSMVADLRTGVVYLYLFHQYDRPVMLNVKEEIANPRAPGALSKLFPEDVQQEAARRFQRLRAGASSCRWVAIAWAAIVLASLIWLVVRSTDESRALRLWVPAVVLLGPLALLARLLVGRCRQPGTWRVALLEAVGDVMPTVVGFVAFLTVVILVPEAQAAGGLVQVTVVLFLPLAVGWLAFQGPLLSGVTDSGYGWWLVRRLPHALVVANLGLAGTTVLALPLVNQSLRKCPIAPLAGWTVIVWAAIVAVSAIVGTAVLFLYEWWAMRGGFQAWKVLAWQEGDVRTPSWRELWWWIVLSYAAVVAGTIAGVSLHLVLTG